MESIFFEVASCAAFRLHLCFNDELATAFLLLKTEVRAERPSDIKSFLCVEGNMAKWNWNPVLVHHLGGLILV